LLVLSPVIITVVTTIAALVFSFKTIAALKMGVIITKITTAFGGVIAAVKGAAIAFAPFMAGAAIPLAIIAIGALIFKFRDEIGTALQAVGQFFVDIFTNITNFIVERFSPLINFFGNIFNGAMEMARNAFNRLPNIVQQAIKAALAPFQLLIRTLQKALNLIARVRGARKQEQAAAEAAAASSATSGSSSATTGSTSSLPYTSGYEESNLTSGNVGSGYAMPYKPVTHTIPSKNPSNLNVEQLPSGGYSITSKKQKGKPPNVNIQTGDVRNFEGTNYVTTQDLQNAVQSGVMQTMNYLEADGVRYNLGM